MTAWTERAVRSTRNTTAAGASTETRKALVYGQYTQVLPIDDIELSLSGIYRTEERHTEKDILADPPALVITHKGTTATLIGTHEKGPVGGIAQLVLEIGKPLPGKHVYHEPALFSYDLTIEGRGSIQAP